MAEFITYGTVLRANGSAVGYIETITPPSSTLETIDTTNLSSANQARTLRPTLFKAGECEVTLQCDTTNMSTLTGFLDPTRAVIAWTVLYPNGTGYTFNGWLTSFDPQEASPDGLARVKCKISVTGKVFYATGLT